MEKVIEVKNLYFSFAEQVVLENMSFDVYRGNFIGITGSNGAGKSTLIKILLKQLPYSGNIKLMGQEISKFNQWEKIGYVSQKSNSFNHDFPATVEEVVGCNLYPKIGFARFMNKKHKELVYASLEKVGMKDFAKRLIGNLSGGQQQRVFIARSLVCSPEILLLDEPTVGIDAKAENTVYCLLKELSINTGITILMITHDLGAITVHADRLFALGDNGLHEYDPKETLDSGFFRQIYGIDLTKHVH